MKVPFLKVSLALVIALFLSGCEVVFTHAPAGNRVSDDALLGRWISEEKESESGTVKFDRGSHGQVNVSFIPGDPQERNPVFTATIVQIGSRSYLVLNPTDKDRDKGFLLAKYEIKGDELVVSQPCVRPWMACPAGRRPQCRTRCPRRRVGAPRHSCVLVLGAKSRPGDGWWHRQWAR